MSPPWTSTLGAALSAEEVASIEWRLEELVGFVEGLTPDVGPVALLEASTVVIDKAFRLRETIGDAFGAANKRAFAPRPREGFARGVSPSREPLLEKLGLDSPEELKDALKELGLLK